MRLFLTLKHWQLFILIMIPMLMPQFMIMDSGDFKWFGAITALWGIIIFGWIYSVGNEANKRLPNQFKKNDLIFKIGFLIALVYMALMAFLIFPNLEISESPGPYPTWAIPLHIASMFGIFYGLWFTSKQFTTLQRGESVKFIDFSGPFFLFWFAPIGVWFLQPRINQVFNDKQV